MDGFVYYVKKGTGDGEIWRVPAKGGKEEQYLNIKVRVLNWALYRDEGICHINFDRQEGPVIEYVDFETRQVKDLAVLGENAIPVGMHGDGFSVSPDGEWILYGQNDWPFDDLKVLENFY